MGETVRKDKLIREPMNSLSNVGFVYVGLYACFCAYYDWKYGNYPIELEENGCYHIGYFPILQFWYGLSSILEGFGAYFYHSCADACPLDAYLDLYFVFVLVWGFIVMVVIDFLFITNVLTLNDRVTQTKVSIIGTCIFLFGSGIFIKWEDWIFKPLGRGIQYLLIAVILAVMVVGFYAIWYARKMEYKPNYDKYFLSLALFSLVVAIGAWYPEELARKCVEWISGTSLFQLHAIWHIFISLASYFPYLYIRSIGNTSIEKNGSIWDHLLLKYPKDHINEMAQYDL